MKIVTNVKTDIPEYITIMKNKRISMEISQKEIAQELNYSPMGISHFEKGRREMKISDIERYCKFIGLEMVLIFNELK